MTRGGGGGSIVLEKCPRKMKKFTSAFSRFLFFVFVFPLLANPSRAPFSFPVLDTYAMYFMWLFFCDMFAVAGRPLLSADDAEVSDHRRPPGSPLSEALGDQGELS